MKICPLKKCKVGITIPNLPLEGFDLGEVDVEVGFGGIDKNEHIFDDSICTFLSCYDSNDEEAKQPPRRKSQRTHCMI